MSSKIRIGHGYDVHRFDPSRPLILGGVRIQESPGLLGHSDADVLAHAVMDALLGAASLRDIGYHFPDTDDKYSGADSMELLSSVCDMIKREGYRIGNVDATVIAQTPKLSPHITAMRERLASVMNIDKSDVNVKATTEEGLGFTGAKEGIAVHAVALIESI